MSFSKGVVLNPYRREKKADNSRAKREKGKGNLSAEMERV